MCQSHIVLSSQSQIFATKFPGDINIERFRGAKDAPSILGHVKLTSKIKIRPIDTTRLQQIRFILHINDKNYQE